MSITQSIYHCKNLIFAMCAGILLTLSPSVYAMEEKEVVQEASENELEEFDEDGQSPDEISGELCGFLTKKAQDVVSSCVDNLPLLVISTLVAGVSYYETHYSGQQH